MKYLPYIAGPDWPFCKICIPSNRDPCHVSLPPFIDNLVFVAVNTYIRKNHLKCACLSSACELTYLSRDSFVYAQYAQY